MHTKYHTKVKKMKIVKIVLLILLPVLIHITGYSQPSDSSKVSRIDFLNMDGEFRKANWGGKDLYYDQKDSLFGVITMGMPGLGGNDKSRDFELVYINGKKIMETAHLEFSNKKRVSILYKNDTLSFYMKLIPITEFLKENTNNAILAPAKEIKVNGKKPNMYFEIKNVVRINSKGKWIVKKKLRNRYRKNDLMKVEF